MASIIRGMNQVTFGKTGLRVSPLGFGGAPIGYLKIDQDRVGNILNALLDSGVNVIDTAASYPGSEEVIGDKVGHRRGEFVLISKCGQSFPDVPGEAWSAEAISATVDRALKRLKTDHLDVMLLHSCELSVLKKGEALGALAEAREAGKIRFAGYSGDNDAAAYAAGLADVAVIEMSISIADQMNLESVMPVARKNNLGVIAKRPIANAAWKDAAQQPGFYGSYASEYNKRLKTMKLSPADLGFSGPADQAWPELALRFTLSQAGMHTAIIGTTDPANAKANIAAAEKGPLSADVVRKISNAFHAADPERKWTGQQ